MTDTTATAPPIAVPESALSTQVDTAIGQIVQAAGGVLLAYGVFTPQHWAAIAAAAPIVGAAAWRIWSATQHHTQLLAVAADPRTPDTVARVVK